MIQAPGRKRSSLFRLGVGDEDETKFEPVVNSDHQEEGVDLHGCENDSLDGEHVREKPR
jgi:hypothetical protein